MAQWLTNRLRVQALALLRGLRIRRCGAENCGGGCRRGSDSALLWLWRRRAAAAPVRPPAWEPPHAAGAAKQMAPRPEEKKEKKNKLKPTYSSQLENTAVKLSLQTSHRKKLHDRKTT